MPNFVWKGKEPHRRSSRRESCSPTRATPRSRSLRRQNDPGHLDQGEGPGDPADAALPRRVAAQAAGDLHPPVLGHARRRPAAGAVPRDPRRAGREPHTSARSSSRCASDVESGRLARRRHAQAPEGVRQSLRLDDRRRRGRRYPGHHPAAPLDLHREGRSACTRQVQVGADLPGRGHLDRRPVVVDHPVEGHPGVRPAVRRPRRRAAVPDPRGHRGVATSSAATSIFIIARHRPGGDGAQPLAQDLPRPPRHRRPSAASSRSSACCCARSPSPASAARCRR